MADEDSAVAGLVETVAWIPRSATAPRMMTTMRTHIPLEIRKEVFVIEFSISLNTSGCPINRPVSAPIEHDAALSTRRGSRYRQA
jgi:hypothetical protein